uniref:Cell division protein n=1 Tax=Stauridium tetras TaxID=271398 RepID=A0A2U8GKJ9_9CHLO|nr:cell division protein [Stauridium tetras]AWI68948.1 cell division protein [Stauridium tetras]
MNPSSFFPQKKSFMQYWIFPFIGFVGLTWNKNSNILETIDFKKNFLNADISRMDLSLVNKTDQNIGINKNTDDISDSIKSSFTFPILEGKIGNQNTKLNFNKFENDFQSFSQFNLNSRNEKEKNKRKNLYQYYFIAKNELEQKLFLLEKNDQEFFRQSLSQLPQNASPDNGFSFDIFNGFTNSFLWSKNLSSENHFLFFNKTFDLQNKKNNFLKTSLNFYDHGLHKKENNRIKKFPIFNVTEIYEKVPKKLFPIPINYTDFNNQSQKKKKRDRFFSVIEVPKTFLIKKSNTSSQPLYSYEKAKILLDNATKNSILTFFSSNEENNTNFKNKLSHNSLEKLKNQSILINKNIKKSKILLNFSLLKDDKKISLIPLELKNFCFEQKIIINSKNSKNLQYEKFLDYPYNPSYKDIFLKYPSSNLFNASLNENRMIMKSIIERLKFDLDKFLLSKKFNMKLHNKMNLKNRIFKNQFDKNIKIYNFSNSNFQIGKNLLKKFKKLKTKMPLTKKKNIKNLIYELSILNYCKNGLTFSNLKNKKMNFSSTFVQRNRNSFMNSLNSQIKSQILNSKIEKNKDLSYKANYDTKFLFSLLPRKSSIFEAERQKSKIALPRFAERSEDEVGRKSSIFEKKETQRKLILNKEFLSKFLKIQQISKKFQKHEENFISSKNSSYNFLQFLDYDKNLSYRYDLKEIIKLNNPILTSSFSYKNQFDFFKKLANKKMNLSSDVSFYVSKLSNMNSKENYVNKNFDRKQKKFLTRSILQTLLSKTKQEKKYKLLPKLKIQKKDQKDLTNLVADLKKIWFRNLNNFYNKFSLFIKKIYTLLYNNLNQKSSLFIKKNVREIFDHQNSKKGNKVSKKLIKRKKNLKLLKLGLNSKTLNFSNIKNKKEKIFRTLLSYKFNQNKYKNFALSKKDFTNDKKIKKTIRTLKSRMQKLFPFFYNKNMKYKFFKKKKSTKQYHFSNHKEKQKNFLYSLNPQKQKNIDSKNKISLNQLLRRISFVFLSELKIKQNFPNLFQNKKQSLILDIAERTIKREEKEKYFQKKRRRKKLKLETRRRKKRKRFYPRPIWLRYALYKNYLNLRHSYHNFYYRKKLKRTVPKTMNNFSAVSSRFENLRSKEREDKKKNLMNISKLFFKNEKLKNKIYRNNKQKWGNFIQDTPKFEKICLKKVNFFPTFPVFQNKEYYKVSNRILAEFQPLCWKSYWLRSNLTPYMNRIEKNFAFMKQVEKTNNIYNMTSFLSKILGFFSYDFNASKFTMLPFYSDFKNSFDNQHAFYISNFFFQESIHKIAEYNRIEFERFSEILKNVKFNMNLEGQQKPKSYKFMAWKYLLSSRELKTFNKKNFWYRLSYNMKPNLSSSSPFVIFSNTFSKNSVSIKPYGSSATLRALWAFNKTNMFTFKEKNQIRNLWEITKLREQLKSNQTRKFFANLIKMRNNLYIKDIFYLKSRKFSQLKDFKSYSKKLSNIDSSTIKKLKMTQRKLVLMSLFQQKSQKKYSYHIIRAKNNNVAYQNFIKILKKRIPNGNKKMKWNKNRTTKLFFFSSLKNKENSPLLNVAKPRLLKPSSYFWWSSKNFQIPFQLNTVSQNNQILFKINEIKVSKKFFIYNILIFSILFHFSLLFSFLRIPELRGLLKFQVLLFYKISNNYFIILYSIYDLLKKYKNETLKTYYSLYKETYKFLSYINLFDLESNSTFAKIKKKNQDSFITEKASRKSKREIEKQMEKRIHFLPFYTRNKKQKKQIISTYFLYNISFYKNLKTERTSYYSNQKMDLKFENKNSLSFSSSLNISNIQMKQWSGFLKYPKINNKDWKPYYSSSVNKNFNKLLIPYITSQKPFIYSVSSNSIEFLFTKKILNKLKKSDLKILKFNLFIEFLNDSYKRFLSLSFIQTQFALLLLYISYGVVHLSIGLFESSYQILLKIIDLFESFLLIIYKFLEKPAELMIEWIAQIFLIEWSSDVSTFVPETFDMYFWFSFQKFFNNSRILGFVEFQNSANLYNQLPSTNFTNHLEFDLLEKTFVQKFLNLSISNLFGFFMQRRLWNFFHLFMDSLFKPDVDLMVRQKKGKIFWDIWADILIRAAEQYNINIPSLTSLKEEQEKLIERLIQDPNFINFSVLNLKQNNNNFPIQKSNIFFASLHYVGEKNQRFLKRAKEETPFDFLKQASNISNPNFNILKNLYRTKSWSSNQYVTFNLKDTDLFLDISPPKSLLYVHFINGYEPIQYTLGSIICEIYSGLFSMKVSKNLLIVNSQVSDLPLRSSISSHFLKNTKSSFDFQSKGSYGSLIIQALAGESEMKIMIDNANRYASIQRGVAVGMKLLRDVFESIVLQTPCFFLMEDIHVIGERRPMLISDDETSYEKEFSIFGFEQDEESEKNQMIYQSSRHSITDFRKPYKGDFSMDIPTNLYNKDFYSFKTFSNHLKPIRQKKYPISLSKFDKNIMNQSNQTIEQNNQKLSASKVFNISRLQILSETFFAPPATSPFTILMMKEQRKLKPKKIIKQMPWNSFVTENIISSNKDSVRVKVAILADMTLRNFSYNKDMITDLLVIIDGVRSNRGFVVFATTHLPSILDPALRRPGRFDETISLPLLPNLTNRWSLFQMYFNLENPQKRISKDTFDRFDYGTLTENFHFSQISNLISKTKLSCNINGSMNQFYNIFSNDFSQIKKNKNLLASVIKQNHTIYPNRKENLFKTSLKSRKLFPSFESTIYANSNKKIQQKSSQKSLITHPSQSLQSLFNTEHEQYFKTHSINSLNKNSKKRFSQISFGYFQVGNLLIASDLLKDQTHFSLYNKSFILEQSSPFVFHTLYSPLNTFKTFIMKLLGGKIAEFLVSKNPRNLRTNNKNEIYKIPQTKSYLTSEKLNFSKNLNFSFVDHMIRYKSWHFATSLVFSILQKRFLYNKNLIITKMLSFDNSNQSSLREPPSPPSSSLLMPSKKYENFKRVERDFQKKAVFSIFEKMQMHQKQRFLKKLYNKPILESFKSQLFANRFTSFESSFKEFSSNKDSVLLTPSSSHSYYKNRLNLRHRFSLINQWWNGQLAEHNVEVTYLSDIDWRTMYIQSNSLSKNSLKENQLLALQKSKIFDSEKKTDYMIDFPDADQHYNPRVRRWFLNTNSWNYWLNFENTFYYDIYFHMIYDSFNKTSLYFDQNRELLDFFVYTYNTKHSLKEIDLLFIFSRFYRK